MKMDGMEAKSKSFSQDLSRSNYFKNRPTRKLSFMTARYIQSRNGCQASGLVRKFTPPNPRWRDKTNSRVLITLSNPIKQLLVHRVQLDYKYSILAKIKTDKSKGHSTRLGVSGSLCMVKIECLVYIVRFISAVKSTLSLTSHFDLGFSLYKRGCENLIFELHKTKATIRAL